MSDLDCEVNYFPHGLIIMLVETVLLIYSKIFVTKFAALLFLECLVWWH